MLDFRGVSFDVPERIEIRETFCQESDLVVYNSFERRTSELHC